MCSIYPGRRDFLKNASASSAGLIALGNIPGSAKTLSAGIGTAAEESGAFELRYRQVHMDFHTSEEIEGIGEQFDPDEFASTLAKAYVNSVTCFGRCIHGWIYHDTKKFAQFIHPHLKRNLLKEQIEACHRKNIRVPVYVIVQWDILQARLHPEWVQVFPDGRLNWTPPYKAGSFCLLCLNSPYVDFLKSYIDDLFGQVPVDGLFLDIVHAQDCSCRHCMEGMKAEGIEPHDDAARRRYGYRVYRDFMHDLSAFIRKYDRNCSIFYNSGHIGPRHREVIGTQTHLELESLPSGDWGYLHFPLTIRFARNLGVDCMGMTGKFHTSWGDFHSFKNKAALEFECFNMLAMNAKCSIGDQLHPNGRIDPATYELIGSVYGEIEKKEPWCISARAVTEIGVLTPEEFLGSTSRTAVPDASFGVARMLQEGANQFDVLDSRSDFSPYRLLILPDEIPVSGELNKKLEEYLAAGGSLIASYESGMDTEKKDFAFRPLGVRKVSDGPLDMEGNRARGRVYGANDYAEYVIPRGEIGKGLPETEHVMYMKGVDVETLPGSVVLADNIKPYFDRTYMHYISHRQTPSSGIPGAPAIIRNGNVIYFSHPIFRQYFENAPRWCRVLFLNAVNMLLPDPLVRHDGPTTFLVTVNEQKKNNRQVIHLLHYIPERRGRQFDVVEDVIPLEGVRLSLRCGRAVNKVASAPEGERIEFVKTGDRIEFTTGRITGHRIIAVEFA